ncbi:hypothetical protein MUK42_19027 [Musa troglodytarum]|uniref:Uncharacterized protein n=1 Tax=Musa troglodytarum TaxID=320322 RepID=A0A9E7K9Q5_9LILI|nr:hypothetical protein MUK42_19027 [Musa troglodytarum]
MYCFHHFASLLYQGEERRVLGLNSLFLVLLAVAHSSHSSKIY